MKPNQDIRELIRKSPFKSYEVAQALGYSSGSALSAKLQTKLSEDERQYFIRKIEIMSDNRLDRNLNANRNSLRRSKVESIYMSEILKKVNQLRMEVDGASTKEDFDQIATLASAIGNLIK